MVSGTGELTHGRTPVLDAHAGWFADPDAWTFDYSVRLTRDFGCAGLALIDVRYHQTPAAEAVHFLLSLIFERTVAGEWQFVFDQNTTLPPAR